MRDKELQEALKLIVNDYRSVYGDSTGNLDSWRFGMGIIDTNAKIEKICLLAAPKPGARKKYLLRMFQHFVAEGYAVEAGNDYALTKLGYTKGSQGKISKGLDFLNKNPGILSVLAILISLFALYVSYSKP